MTATSDLDRSAATDAPPSGPTGEIGARPRRRRVQTPRVLQMESNESGAACLGMILGAHERFVDLDELCLQCGVTSGEGATVQSIARAAEHYGLDATIGTYEPEDLAKLTLPFIANWRFHHDVVVEGWRPGHWYLNDPARGPWVCTPSPDSSSRPSQPPILSQGASARSRCGAWCRSAETSGQRWSSSSS